MSFRLIVSTLLLLGGLSVWSPVVVRAELILDDFDDPVEVVAPAMLNQYVDTANVGDLHGTRSVRIFGLGASPEGRIDVGFAGSSSFHASLGKLNADGVPLPKFVSVQSDYQFTASDATQSGQNNAVLYDFRHLTSAVVPAFLRIIVHDTTNSYEAVIPNVPLSETPFTLAMPFDDFRVRGGGPTGADFTRIQSAFVTLRILQSAGPVDLQFEMDLERIRFGRVPEASGNGLILLGIGLLLVAYRCNWFGNFRRNDHGTMAYRNYSLHPCCFRNRSCHTGLGGDGCRHTRGRTDIPTTR